MEYIFNFSISILKYKYSVVVVSISTNPLLASSSVLETYPDNSCSPPLLLEPYPDTISAAIVALDRQELDQGKEVAKTLMDEFDFPIYSISNLSNLIIFLKSSGYEDVAEKLNASLND